MSRGNAFLNIKYQRSMGEKSGNITTLAEIFVQDKRSLLSF